ncbi:MAG: ParB/RepB/Spo0J family partition protein [bacterium]|nr:ParB/RepB/Spo0J family partition protein [bacterium]
MKIDMSQAEFKRIPVEQIRRFANQPRKHIDQGFLAELTSTTKNVGQPTPILVKLLDNPVDGCLYELIDGEQRWRACVMAGVAEIPAMVIKVKDEKEQFMLSVITNVQKSTLTPKELALSIERLQSMEMSQREIGKLFGKSQAWVHVRHSLLTLEQETLALAGSETREEKRLSQTQAYLLVGLPPKNQKELARKISEEQLSVTDSRRLIAETVRTENIKPACKNTSRLCMIEDLKIFRNFAKRTDNYLENFLSMENGKFQRMFLGGKGASEVAQLKATVHKVCEEFKELEECLQKVEDSMTSKSLEIEQVDEPGDKSTRPDENKSYNGQPHLWRTISLLKRLEIPDDMLYSPRRNGKSRRASNSSFWNRSVDHLGILEMAKKAYREKILAAHPDKLNGNKDEAATLISVWKTIEKRFKLQGFTLGK